MDVEAPRHPDLGAVVVSEQQLRDRISELGKEITGDYQGRAPLLVGVLKGAFMFMADLAREVALPVEFDFMAVSSYGSATKTSGVVRIVKDLDLDLSDRDVLLVEDIVDTGLTLNYLRKNLASRHPASLEVCALLVREGLQREDPDIRYVGFRIPPEFVVGYGLDVGEQFRNLPYVAVYQPQARGGGARAYRYPREAWVTSRRPGTGRRSGCRCWSSCWLHSGCSWRRGSGPILSPRS